MKVVFFGSDEYSVPHLEKLLEISDVVLVVTTPDAPMGRGKKISPTPVKKIAIERKIEYYDSKLKDRSFLEKLEALNPDLGIVASFGKIIPKVVFEKFEYGVFCVHPSLLPKYRGAAPMRRVLENGERISGVTIFRIVEKLDAGPIALQRSFDIGPYETYGELFEKSVRIGVEMLEEFSRLLKEGNLKLKDQNESEASYAPKLEKWELKIDFSMNFEKVKNKIRSLDPKPGAFAFLKKDRVKLFGVAGIDPSVRENPGKILNISKEGAWIACGEGAVLVKSIQFPGKGKIDFLSARNGKKVKEGDVLG